MTRLAPLAVAVALLAAAAACPDFCAAGVAADRFDDDPGTNGRWSLRGEMRWVPEERCLTSWAGGTGTALWQGRSLGGVILEARLMLVSSETWRAPRTRIVFAADPGGGYRYVSLVAGSPGRVVVGQQGTVGGKRAKAVIAERRVGIRTGAWYTLRIYLVPGGGVQVSLGEGGRAPRVVLTAAGLNAAKGMVGFRSIRAESRFDDFRVIWEEDAGAELCRHCHDGSPLRGEELGPNVMTYWNGSWWDRRYDGSDRVQQGGHGDPDGLPATTCSGRTGCHDLSQSPRSHRDGRLHYPTRAPDAVTDNTYHLRAPFLPADPVNAWDVQVTFDRFCYTACHESQDVTEMTHERDGSPAPGVVQLGTHLTSPHVSWWTMPLDNDLTSRAFAGGPRYAPCVACHDPHGTGLEDGRGYFLWRRHNAMLRDSWYSTSTLCGRCHI